jgi:hypothetical protein
MVADSTVNVDRSRRPAVIEARRQLLEAAALEAHRIAEDVDPDDRSPEQVALLSAAGRVATLRKQWDRT